ncbi:MAG TPA: PLP-dependent aspartate aminotransferase family protein [Hyphomicrobiaceae bacterium]|jgi:cystathionine gamma-synthase|nr:PLP-dependent aspartate aminotransferase family protein [Hyphomicrobiaceae bacterium]
MKRNALAPETVAAQAGEAGDETTGATVPPVHLATTFLRDPDNQYRKGFSYGRPDNASVRQVERVLGELEGGAASLVVASGMTAATTAFLALERPAHVVAPNVMYWGLRDWIARDAPSLGIEPTFVDATDPAAIAAAVRPGHTKLVWIETPANPLWSLSDIAAAAKIAHTAGALLAVDSTVSTPVLTQPLTYGADIVMHSATKYLNGHSDVMAGALVFARRDAYFERASRSRTLLGGILGPFEAALLLRGMRTLHVRVRHQSAAAMAIASHFQGDRRLEAVLYPGSPAHPGHAIARRQMQGGFGGMLSLRVRGGETAAVAVAAKVRVWKRATSLGGVESLIEHRASIEGPASPCPPDLLRLSVGLESTLDLIDDLEQALS